MAEQTQDDINNQKKVSDMVTKVVAGRKYSPLDPYTANMHRFFNEIVVREPEQAYYLTDYGHPELKGFFKARKDNNTGDFLGLVVTNEDGYKKKKEELNLF